MAIAHTAHIPHTNFTRRLTKPLATDIQVTATPLLQRVPHWPSIPITESAERAAHLGVDAIFRALPIATTPQTMEQMQRRERIVLMLLDGKRTIRDVARLVHRSELDVARTLVWLLKSGYIEYSTSETRENLHEPDIFSQ